MTIELMREEVADAVKAQKRRHLLARMAGNIASGYASQQRIAGEMFNFEPPAPEEIARRSVAIARAILAELEVEP